MIRLMQQQGATKEDIIAFIKKAKAKKTSPKLDICKNFDNTKIKPVLPDDAPIAIVLFAGGGGIEAGMVQADIRPVIAVEFDPSKPELSRAFVEDVAEGIAFNHHHNFHEYGCKVIQQTVQEGAQSEFAGFPRRPDYLHDYQTMTTKTPKPQNLQSIFRVLGVGC
jgi:DNA (cytosine-5)-methyltransferase 1